MRFDSPVISAPSTVSVVVVPVTVAGDALAAWLTVGGALLIETVVVLEVLVVKFVSLP